MNDFFTGDPFGHMTILAKDSFGHMAICGR